MTVQEIISIVELPETPIDTGAEADLKAVEEELGIVLPDDLVDYAGVFGSGEFKRFGRWFTVYNPYSPSYIDTVRMVCEVYSELKDVEGSEQFPYNVYPNSPGLFPWGDEDNGHQFFWLTAGEPEEWPVVVCASDPREFEVRHMAMTKFLASIFKGTISCIIFGESDQEDLRRIEFNPKIRRRKT